MEKEELLRVPEKKDIRFYRAMAIIGTIAFPIFGFLYSRVYKVPDYVCALTYLLPVLYMVFAVLTFLPRYHRYLYAMSMVTVSVTTLYFIRNLILMDYELTTLLTLVLAINALAGIFRSERAMVHYLLTMVAISVAVVLLERPYTPKTGVSLMVLTVWPGVQYCMLRSKFEAEATAAKQTARVYSMAHTDELTGIYNRRMGMKRLEKAIEQGKEAMRAVGVMTIDLDRFKDINDSYGHDTGDRILTIVAQRMMSVVEEKDTVARMGGDEFMVVIADLEETHVLEDVAVRFSQAVKEPVHVKEANIEATLSIGIAVFPYDGFEAETLLKKSDLALYAVKEGGRNGYEFNTNIKDIRRF